MSGRAQFPTDEDDDDDTDNADNADNADNNYDDGDIDDCNRSIRLSSRAHFPTASLS